MPNIPFRYAAELYDDIWIPEETIQVRETVRAFAEQYLRPAAHQLNNTPESLEAFPRELVKEMANAGLFRIPFAAEYGGAGLQYPTLATMVMLEEISYLSSGLAASMIDVQLILFGHTLSHASATVKEQLFPAMMGGDIIGSFATSEPAASTDLSVRALQTEARKVDGGYQLSGQKRWITNSPNLRPRTQAAQMTPGDETFVSLSGPRKSRVVALFAPSSTGRSNCGAKERVGREAMPIGICGHVLASRSLPSIPSSSSPANCHRDARLAETSVMGTPSRGDSA